MSIQHLAESKISVGETVSKISRKPERLPELFEGLKAGRANIKYGCLKALRQISEQKPEILYSSFDAFVDLFDSQTTFFQWGAIIIIANLASVDSENRFEAMFKKYFAPITGNVMITASNIIKSAPKIALAKPMLADRITKEIMKVEKASYKTGECRNVALGQAVKSMSQFFNHIKDKKTVFAFVRRQLGNSRPATRKAAEQFLRKHG